MSPGSWNSGGSSSPDGDSLLGIEPHRVILAHAEGFVEGVDIADDLVAAELGGRVGVRGDPTSSGLVSDDPAPDRGVGQEEPLLPGQSGNGFGLVPVEGDLKGLEGDAGAAEVADVLSDGQLAVDMRAVGAELLGDQFVVLGDETFGALLEGRAIVSSPPVTQQTLPIAG